MDTFYKLLVKDSLDREDVEEMEKEKQRNSYEVLQMFRESNGIYCSFIAESVLQLVFGSLIDSVLIWTQVHFMAPEIIGCEFQGQNYFCIVPLATFYAKILGVAIVMISVYLICNVYTLAW